MTSKRTSALTRAESTGSTHSMQQDEEEAESDGAPLIPETSPSKPLSMETSAAGAKPKMNIVSKTGLFVLLLLALHNCFHTLLMRFVMKGRPKFLTSSAVLGTEVLKLVSSVCFIVFYEKKTFQSIIQYLKEDYRNTLLLIVPAAAYNLQRSLEYVALANLSAAMFSVLVQSKLFFTATFSMAILQRRLKIVQLISLVLLTVGVMLCNLSNATDKPSTPEEEVNESVASTRIVKGIVATLSIALSSGFASVYTEKVIKAQRDRTVVDSDQYGLAYTQVQLALMSAAAIGVWIIVTDMKEVVEKGFFHDFTAGAWISIVDSTVGGLLVAAVLKYADAVLKGYATAISVVITGILSMLLFGTSLSAIYFMGIINVVTAVLLFNGKDLDKQVGCYGGAT